MGAGGGVEEGECGVSVCGAEEGGGARRVKRVQEGDGAVEREGRRERAEEGGG